MKRIIFLIAIIALAISAAGGGEIRGKVLDSETGDPLAGANIKVVDNPRGGATNLDGEYIIEHLEPGTYELKVGMIGYTGYRVTEITVVDGEPARQQHQALRGHGRA